MKLCIFILFCTSFSGIAAFTILDVREEFQYYSNFSSVVQNDGANCQKGKCKDSSCKCCPGYYYREGWTANFCEECNCGEGFNCTFKHKTICTCPTGYSQVQGKCKADCKSNPCANDGKCTVKNDKVLCECKEPYTGELCKDNMNCNIGTCKDANCTCCPGYYLFVKGFWTQSYSCEECNCGEGFNCTYKYKVICSCPTGYSEVLQKCSADCKRNPCENGGKCTVNENKVVCECKKPYTGELCKDKPSTKPLTETTTTTMTVTTQAITKSTFPVSNPETSVKKETTTELITVNDIVSTRESFKNVTAKSTMSTTKWTTVNKNVSSTKSLQDVTSSSTSDSNDFITEITTSTTSEDKTTTTTITYWFKCAPILAIALSTVAIILALFSICMVLKYKNKY